jgi:nicotinic acid mononucleotide adenylyltransferase
MKKYSQFLRELPSNTVVFAFGRFNPPTTGHELLVKAVKKLATQNKAAHAIYASKSQDAKKNPLTVEKKVHYLKLMFPGTNFVAANPTERTFIEAAKALNKKYKNLIMVAGSDRIPEYERILNTYNGKEFHFDTVQVISAGERDPDSDDASGMSASKMRAVASKGDYSQFKKGLPSAMREIDGRRLMNDVRLGMGLEVVKEQLNLVKDDLREQYFRGEIFNIGDIVESAGISYEIVKRGSNHLLLKEESGKLVSKWIQDISLKQEELNLEETMIPEELTTKTLKSQDKIKVARIIATMLGIENAESSANPDQLVNNALRKVRTKSLNAESLNILTKMLALAQEVGIKYDVTLVPSKLKESEEVDTKSTYNIAKGNLSYKDYIKLRDINAGVHHTKPGHSFNHDDETERKMKVKYQTEAVDKNHPIAKEYDSLKKNHDIKSLRGLIKTQHKIIDTSEFKTKDHAISHYLRAKHGNKKVADAFGLKEEQLDEISAKLAGNYYGAATKKHIDKVGVKANMYDRIEKDMGKKRKQGIDRAMDRVMGARKTNEQYEEMLQELEEAISTIDKGEYDYEGAMARTQLQTTIRSSQELINMLSLDDNLPEWVQSKITLAQDYITSARDYLKSREELGEEATPYWKKASFNKRMSQMAKQERREREQKEAEQKKQVKEELEEAADMATLRKQLNKHTELAVKANRAGDDDAVKKHQVTMNKIKDRMNKMVKEASEVCPNCEQTVDKCECESKDVVRDDSQQVGANNSKGFDAFFEEDESGSMQHGVVDMSNYEDNYNDNMGEEEISDEELDAMADEIQDMEHIMDVYDDDEFAIVDDETGEELEETEEEKSVNEQTIMEVLSRLERMKAKMRIRRTKAKRERATKIALKRYSGTATINKRARRLAVKLMKKRLLRGRDATKISVGEKERVERVIERRKKIIGRLAMRLAPRVRKIEKARMAHKKFTAPAPVIGM